MPPIRHMNFSVGCLPQLLCVRSCHPPLLQFSSYLMKFQENEMFFFHPSYQHSSPNPSIIHRFTFLRSQYFSVKLLLHRGPEEKELKFIPPLERT